MAHWTAQQNFIRAVALQNGLNPDEIDPADVELLATDKEGTLLATKEYEKTHATFREIEYYRKKKESCP